MDPSSLVKPATEAAKALIEAGALGSIIVLLAVAFVATVVMMTRALGKKDGRIEELNEQILTAERGFRAEILSVNTALTGGLATVQQAISLVTNNRRVR